MKSQRSYEPPPYIPLGQSDSEADIQHNKDPLTHHRVSEGPSQWSSGICACCDDLQSCCIGLFCPCFLFGKNAEFLGSGTLIGSCTTHFILCGLLSTVCCLLTDGLLLGLPACFVASYACGYRRALRSRKHHAETLLRISSVICVLIVKNTGRSVKDRDQVLILTWPLLQLRQFRRWNQPQRATPPPRHSREPDEWYLGSSCIMRIVRTLVTFCL
ncbi:cell number regulator 5 isoform X1 [Morus notabilis]|uniref:cell number regulator 5 isoform X1 n=1 Tax=Morus notabilis TaxID=981085 RepID=UPI000CECF953|nr:cell number regulator 5 isoform X1 [Morus notabilis]